MKRTLFVGLNESEKGHIRSWMSERGGQAWFTEGVIGALRTFEEIGPERVVIDTLAPQPGALELARMLAAASPKVELVFLGNHKLEAPYYEAAQSSTGSNLNARFEWRPLHPASIVPEADKSEISVSGYSAKGKGNAEVLAGLFFALLRTKENGELYVGKDYNRRKITFIDGKPVYAESRILDENLGHALKRWGVITDIEFEWARNLQLNEGVRQGEALVKIGVLTPERLDHYLYRQVREKMVNAFREGEVSYHFERRQGHFSPNYKAVYNPVSVVFDGLKKARGAHPPVPSHQKVHLNAAGVPLPLCMEAFGPRVWQAISEGVGSEHFIALFADENEARAASQTLAHARLVSNRERQVAVY